MNATKVNVFGITSIIKLNRTGDYGSKLSGGNTGARNDKGKCTTHKITVLFICKQAKLSRLFQEEGQCMLIYLIHGTDDFKDV